MPVVVLTGLRQTGKTTLLQQDPCARGRRFLTLDDLPTLEAARRNPDDLLSGDEAVSIDEAQRCPDLLLAIKRHVDHERRSGQFLLSGSASLGLLEGVSESLAGRAIALTLHPFSYRECHGRLRRTPFLIRFLDSLTLSRKPDLPPWGPSTILDGGMPSVVLGHSRRGFWFRGYEQTYLERDVRELSQVGDLVVFRNFLRLAANRTGQILNQSALARDAAISAATASRYLGVLEASFVVRRLPPFSGSQTTRLVKSPKLFVSDSGLASHLTGVEALSQVPAALRGALLETWIAQNLSAILEVHRPSSRLCFWNVQGRHEVDFVIDEPGGQVALEVKSAAQFRERDLVGLRAFLSRTRTARAGILAYGGKTAVALDDGLFAVPIALLAS